MAVKIRRHSFAVIRVIALGLMFVACDKKSPRSPLAPPPSPPPQSASFIVRLELGAPPDIAPGESVQLTANAIKSDGSVKNVSNQAQATWRTTDSRVLDVSSTGLATGKDRGLANVSVFFQGNTGIKSISVLPKGTFRLIGTIRESGVSVPNVAVTVVSGVGEGLTTQANSNGGYSLFGVSGPVQLLLRKEGYLDATPKVDVTAHRGFDVNMVAERPRKDYTGAYTLTISAGPPCAASLTLPDDAKRRVYTANVTQDAGRLTVTLTDADFIVSSSSGNRFFGFVDLSDGLTFSIGEDFYYYSGPFDIVERFGDTALIVNGIVTARGTPQTISGTLKGSILVSTRASAPFFPFKTQCFSPTHEFEMVRR